LTHIETSGKGIFYENKGHTRVMAYSNTDWVCSPLDRRSTSRFCIFVGKIRSKLS